MLVLRQTVMAFLLICGATAWAGNLAACLERAPRMGHDPASRDDVRTSCLQQFKKHIDFKTCLKAARGFEYSTNSEEMKNMCLFELKRTPTARQCAAMARSMEYGGNRDDLIWGCLKRLNLTIGPKDCRMLAQMMVYPYQQNRAASYCAEEIRATRL